MIEYEPSRPKWEQIAEVLRERIKDGTYPTGHKLSEVALEGEFGVARTTVKKATRQLREEGLIVTTVGMGSFVRGDTSR